MRNAGFAIAFCISGFGASVAGASDDGRLVTLRYRLNPELSEHYRMGPAVDPSGRTVEIMTTLYDRRVANEYNEGISKMSADPVLGAGRLGSFAMLAAVGDPSPENMGVMLFSHDDQMPTVAGLSLLYGTVNNEKILPEAGVVNFDGHIHTGRSHDGGDSYEAVFEKAVSRGLNAVAITEHNEFDFGRAQMVLQQMQAAGRVPQDFLLIPGEEITSSDGHILAYFIARKIQPGMSAVETIAAIHAQGGIAVAPHPSGSGGVGLYTAYRLPFDGIEVMSGANVLPVGLLMDSRETREQARRKFKMANSDAHAARGVGVLFTRVAVLEHSLEGLKAAMLRGRTEPRVENSSYRAYFRVMGSRTTRAILWPVLTYLDLKGEVSNRIAALLFMDRVSVMSNWETTALRMANGIFLPVELSRLAGRTSEFQRGFTLQSVSAVKGPLRLAYEKYDLLGFSQPEATWRLEAKVEF